MYTIGADPEFFITNGESSVVPIVGLIGGTKDRPHALGDGYAYQEDNVMAEYNIPPCYDESAFASAIATGRNLTLAAVRKTLPKAGYSRMCAVEFSANDLSNPQAQTFGCSPDYDAYAQGRPMPRIMPESLTTPNGAWRFAGGHVHLGYKDEITWGVPDFVVAALCDLFIGLPVMVQGYDEQGERRRFYGSPGRYRPTSYGIEYRTLSNRWTLTARGCVLVARMSFDAMYHLQYGEDWIRCIYNDMPWADVRRAIASEDYTLASQLNQFVSNYVKENRK